MQILVLFTSTTVKVPIGEFSAFLLVKILLMRKFIGQFRPEVTPFFQHVGTKDDFLKTNLLFLFYTLFKHFVTLKHKETK